MFKPRSPRKTYRETVTENQAALTFMAKLAGKPAPDFKIKLEPVKPRKAAEPSIYPSEAVILKTILKYLRLHPKVGLVVRINSGTFVETYNDKERYIQTHNCKGMSDIFGVLKTGQAFFIEAKSHAGRVSQDQDNFILKALQCNALAGIARSIEDVNAILHFS